ncbi:MULTISPECIES: hypothetical protein [Alicyclobacillus]|uniref:Uncharacterized protein n=2 Tax=Alicyclobacillus tolerans TaxID=90970 RepID=A0A1M6LA58_9BACL|nr:MULTISPECIES: hypothetical protein [Alicyclobacillus]MDP9727529.1 hypothetical protein [Alicyclobacillus tengchongensis]SHJ68053.1 hypothetical protein SAMN05443507_102144 [Alicyclobacillus montanus]
MFRCPACGEYMEALTKFHCLSHHGMNRSEFIAKYGRIQYIFHFPSKELEHWLQETTTVRQSLENFSRKLFSK